MVAAPMNHLSVENAFEMAPPEPGEQAQQNLVALRELRAEVQDLQSVLDKVRKGQAAIETYATYITKTMEDIEKLMARIVDGDTIRHVLNIWEQMKSCPLLTNPQGTFEAQQQMHYLNMLDAQIQALVYLIGVVTIPERVNRWLDKARPGYYIPFHLVFEDELPSPVDRAKVLSYLAWAPEVVKSGIVDAANGLIYRYATDAKSKWGSIVWFIATFILATAVVVGACYLTVPGWPIQPKHLPLFLAGWGAVLVGVVVHLGVGSVKRSQQPGALPPIIALGDLPLIINARIGTILLKLSLALIGFFGLVFASGVDNVTPLNTFLVGYSLDSVVEVFGASAEQQATAQVAALKKQLGLTEKQP